MTLFYDWFLEQKTLGNRENQQEAVEAAGALLEYINGDRSDINPKHKWLWDKIHNENNSSSNFLVEDVTPKRQLEEIVDPNNASAKKYYAKIFMKQGVEETQLRFLSEQYNIDSNRGKNSDFPITASGKNSYRFTTDGEFKKGIKKTNNTTKSIDSLIFIDNTNYFTVQKVTTDNGGGTDSVRDDVLKTLNANLLYLEKNPDIEDKFLYLLDGPYWTRKDRQDDEHNRIDQMKIDYTHPNIIICNSDEFGSKYGTK